jgi:hypothetical protein
MFKGKSQYRMRGFLLVVNLNENEKCPYSCFQSYTGTNPTKEEYLYITKWSY